MLYYLITKNKIYATKGKTVWEKFRKDKVSYYCSMVISLVYLFLAFQYANFFLFPVPYLQTSRFFMEPHDENNNPQDRELRTKVRIAKDRFAKVPTIKKRPNEEPPLSCSATVSVLPRRYY